VLDGLALLHAEPLHDALDTLEPKMRRGHPRARGRSAREPGSPWRPERPRS
jgi:hypothetical protein